MEGKAMRKWRRILFCLLLVGWNWLPQNLWGQEATAVGTVTEAGRPIVGAIILAREVGGTEDIPIAVTDQEGKWTASGPPGSYILKVKLSGYRNLEQRVTAKEGETKTVDFQLEPLITILGISAPKTLAQGETAKISVQVKNDSPDRYILEDTGLLFYQGEKDLLSEYTVTPDSANPTTLEPGATATLNFTVAVSGKASTGTVTMRASLFAYNSNIGAGKNLLSNSGFEKGSVGWGFGTDNNPDSRGRIVTGIALTGQRSAQITNRNVGTDARGYWTQVVSVQPGTYTLSGYVKTEDLQGTGEPRSGADVYAPVGKIGVAIPQFEAPYLTGTKDWRKNIITFTSPEGVDDPTIYARAEVYLAVGTAYFDNMALSAGEVDGSLTVTGGDTAITITPAGLSAPTLLSPKEGEVFRANPPTFSWEAITGATRYEVEVASDPNFTQTLFKDVAQTASLTPSRPLPMTRLYWRVRALSETQASPWVSGSYLQSFTPKLSIISISGPVIPPGGTGTILLEVRNEDLFTYNIDAVGVRFLSGGQDVSGKYLVEEAVDNPKALAPGETGRFKLSVKADPDAPSGTINVTGNLFAYNTAVGSGANLIGNPSLERGAFAEEALPEGWAFINDAPSEADHFWVRDTFVSGNKAIRLDKTAPQNQSYIQWQIPGELLKTGTPYLFSGWVKTQDRPEAGGESGLLLWWNDGNWNPSGVEAIKGTKDWTYLAVAFTTGEKPLQQAVARGNVFGTEGGSAWFDNFALSEGLIDGAVTLRDVGSGTLGIVPPAIIRGDLNGDGKVGLQDAILALRIAVGSLKPNAQQLSAGDLDGDGKISLGEVIRILRAAVGIGKL